VVGIVPDLASLFHEQDVWLPLEFDLSKIQNGRGYHWYIALGRLKPNVSLRQANAEVRAIASTIAAQHPRENLGIGARAVDLRQALTADYQWRMLVLFGLVALILVLCCANVATLALVRAASRVRDFSVRIAIGANRPQIITQVLTESILLSIVATAAGYALAYLLVRMIVGWSALRLPMAPNIHLDWRVFVFAAALAFLCGLGFGLAPALRATQVDVAEALKQSSGRTTDSRSHQNLRRSFVFAQGLIAALLAVVCALLLRSFAHAAEVNPGFDVQNMLTAHISLPRSRLDYEHPGKVGDFTSKALERIRQIPGVLDAAIASDLPLTDSGAGAGVLVEGKSSTSSPFSAPFAQWTLVSPGYFTALGIPILQGRDFQKFDRQNTPLVTIVNSSFVRRFLGGGPALGKRISLATNPTGFNEIVGVVGDVHQSALEQNPVPQVFFSLNQLEDAWLVVFARTQGNPLDYVAPIQRVIQQIDPEIAVFLPRTMEQTIAMRGAWRTFETSLVGIFAVIAIGLSALGTFAVISFSITQRTAEIGIRMALGASAKQVLRHFVQAGIFPALAGVLAGLLLAPALARSMSPLLFRVTPYDFPSYAVAFVILCLTALLASVIPALRAARLPPSRALRHE